MSRHLESTHASIASRLFDATALAAFAVLGVAVASSSQAGSKGDAPMLEFTTTESRNLSHVLQIEGQAAAVPRVAGGWIKARVETSEVDGSIVKQVVGLGHEDLVVDFDLGSVPGHAADWIRASFEQRFDRRNGAWAETDDSGNVVRVREFFDAHITELRFPTLDASSQESAPVQLTFSAEAIEDADASSLAAAASAEETHKTFLVSNFDLEIDGLSCEDVIEIDQIVIARASRADDAPLEVQNLVLRLPAAVAAPWADWFESFVIDGKSSSADELSGSIRFLAPDLETELGRLELHRVGIVALSYDDAASAAAGFDVMRAELYVQSARVELGGSDR